VTSSWFFIRQLEHINVVCEQNAGIMVLNVMVSAVTTGHNGLICVIGTG